MKNLKKNVVGIVICFAIYAISELVYNFQSSYLIEIILLFTGTLAIGGIIGFLIRLGVSKVRE